MRLICTAIFACVSSGGWAASAPAGSYPAKPIRVILGFAGGGADDFLARLIGP